MATLIEGKAPPPDQDSILIVSDAYGDYLNSAADQIAEYENDVGNVYLTEVSERASLYRVPVMLSQRYGLKPATIAVIAHGDEDAFAIVGPEYEAVIGPGTAVEPGDILKANIRRFTHDYMVPSQVTGERSIVLSSCSQAGVGRATGRSIIEAVASRTDPEDRVVVSGARARYSDVLRLDMADEDDRALVQDAADLYRTPLPDSGSPVFFWNVTYDEPAATHSYRKRDDGMNHSISLTIPGV
jgi:hypothetical protein